MAYQNAQNLLFPQPSHLGHAPVALHSHLCTNVPLNLHSLTHASDSFRLSPPGPCHYDHGVRFKSSLLLYYYLVGIITTAPELYHGHRNEHFGISHSSGRLGQRSRYAHRQRLNLVRSCQQSRRVVLFPYPPTSYRATNIDG